MTNQLIIHFPEESILIISDESDKISILAEFCNIELNSYHSTENIYELSFDEINEEMYNKFIKLASELGLNLL